PRNRAGPGGLRHPGPYRDGAADAVDQLLVVRDGAVDDDDLHRRGLALGERGEGRQRYRVDHGGAARETSLPGGGGPEHGLARSIGGVELGPKAAGGEEAMTEPGHLVRSDPRQHRPVLEPLEAGAEDLPGRAGQARSIRRGLPSPKAPGPGNHRAKIMMEEAGHGRRLLGAEQGVVGQSPELSRQVAARTVAPG